MVDPRADAGDSHAPIPNKSLRLWPGAALAAILAFAMYLLPLVAPGAGLASVLTGFAAILSILLWWLFFSRAPWLERLGAVAVAAGAMFLTYRFLHPSVAKGNMGYQYLLLGLPLVALALVIGAAAGGRQPPGRRRAILAACLVAASAGATLFRSDGVTGAGKPQLAWRFTATAEEKLLAAGEEKAGAGAGARAGEGAEWPGLRGRNRDGVVAGPRLARDWSATPPAELWRRPIGPGVSSFAISGKLLFTQEQRGEEEIVSCHDLETGELVWKHQDQARFWDAHVGAGPRATPAFANGKVYTLGATGILNALDAAGGKLAWSRNAAADAGAKTPMWGFVSSPLVVGDLLVVQAGSLLAYDLESGEKRWQGPPKRGSYSSPQLLTIAGMPQIVLIGHGATFAVSPSDGSVLWEHPWEGIGIVQPAQVGEGDLLISLVDGGAVPIGTRRLLVTKEGAGWKVEERWTSNRLKPSFSDVVIHEGHAYGIDGRIFAAIDLATGERAWKGGRYGEGQVLLLPDQDLLLVLTEDGELALVAAKPEGFEELARMPLLSGKTWSQPALVGDLLVVRNGEEMAAFRLPPEVRKG
jgi:outer membrane protein assembly factor BamB